MTANEKRAIQLATGMTKPGEDLAPQFEMEGRIATALDAAERRGEERVLRWMRARGWDGAIVDYRKARRARVGRGRK